MRVSDLDRDHSQIFVSSQDPDSAFLVARMQASVLELVEGAPPGRVLDVAAGLGKDGRTLTERGRTVTNVEPSKSLTDLERLLTEREGWKDLGAGLTRVRAWSESLPFADETFAASFCKGSLDHFDDPVSCIREMARVTRRDGRVVLAVANMDALALRWMRSRGARARARRDATPSRRHWDVPADHLTRYDPQLLREHLELFLRIDVWMGVSLLWGLPVWQRLLRALPSRTSERLLQGADYVGRRLHRQADLMIVSGKPIH